MVEAMESPLRLVELLDEVEGLDSATFTDRYGEAYLLQSGAGAPLQPANRSYNPTVNDGSRRAGGGQLTTEMAKMLLYPVRRRDSSGLFITVGRAKTSDIPLRDESVSAFHAFFQRRSAGEFILLDAGSKNGTFVNSEPVPREGVGRPTAVVPGDEIRFGSVVTTFLLCEELLALARRTS